MKLIFDIGFNVGSFSKAWVEKYPKCKILAVEANPLLVEGRSDILNFAVSNRDGEMIELYVDRRQPGASTVEKQWMEGSRFATGSRMLAPKNVNWDIKFNVPTVTLDTLIKTHGKPDYIKLDIEGHEAVALQGLSKKQKLISLEWTEEGGHILAGCVNKLLELGYKEFSISGYFEEGPAVEVGAVLKFDDHGDTYTYIPSDRQFFSWETIAASLAPVFKPERAINYGMLFAR
jgi:FkbM family methyltransferase